MLRDDFEAETGFPFDLTVLGAKDKEVCDAIVEFGVDLYDAISELC
jgi:hypothetical protein